MVKIITHGGSAHLDDFMSTCLVIHKFGDIDVVERRDPTKEEINDPNIWKLDVGMELDPSKKAFDHHLEEEIDDCTLSILLKYWGMWKRAIGVHKWLKVAVAVDTGGYSKLMKTVDAPLELMFYFYSFMEKTLLKEFQRRDIITKEDPIFPWLHKFGEEFFSEMDEYENTMDAVNEHAKFVFVNGVPVIYCLDVEPTEVLPRIMSEKKNELWKQGGIAVFPNNRGEDTISLKRYDNDERVDFRNIPEDDENVVFVHSSGFFAAIKALPRMEIERYIKQAIKVN